MQINTKCRVNDGAQRHRGRVGYYQFTGDGIGAGIAVLSVEPCQAASGAVKTLAEYRNAKDELFAVWEEDLTIL